ncbi:DUF952 domain-containing protein [Emcibacter sp. SYSU 3D8]|uniref:DUF952 domain-containing protein n=1 Tax=Emcibacter sp. SYSU 3D8 TaxID=3133969 RepID=UPI0031FF0F35
MNRLVYKICSRAEWAQAVAAGSYAGSAVDRADGFIHFSTAQQAPDTAAKHFAGQHGLVLVQIDTNRLPREVLKWEPSRGGALFPHLYAPLPVTAALRVDPLPWRDGAGHLFPESLDDA